MKGLLCLMLVLLCSITIAQPPGDGPRQDKEEYIRTQKIAFISTELALTTEEAEKFWPVYNEYDAKMEEIRKERRGYMKQLKSMTDLSDDDAYTYTEKLLDCDAREAAVRKEYLSKFADVVGKKKAARVFMAEEKFKHELLKTIQDHYKNHDGPPPPRD